MCVCVHVDVVPNDITSSSDNSKLVNSPWSVLLTTVGLVQVMSLCFQVCDLVVKVSFSVCTRVYIAISVCICVCVHACVHTRAHMCVCVCRSLFMPHEYGCVHMLACMYSHVIACGMGMWLIQNLVGSYMECAACLIISYRQPPVG